MTETQSPFSGGGGLGTEEPVQNKPIPPRIQNLMDLLNSRLRTISYLIDPDGAAIEITFTAATGLVTYKNGEELVSLPYKRL